MSYKSWLLAAAIPFVSISGVFAQIGWAVQPLWLSVPYAAGGSNPIIARTLSQPLSQLVGQPVVENALGDSSVGTGQAKDQAADGYTLIMGDISSIGIKRLVGGAPDEFASFIQEQSPLMGELVDISGASRL